MAKPISQSDDKLLQLMAAGDDQAFTALYRRHQETIYRFALLMSGSANIAEEVTQEVFLVLIRETQRYDPERGRLPAFLCGVARNHVLRILERERPYVSLVEESEDDATMFVPLTDRDDPLGNCTRNEVIRLVRQAVLTLPTPYREAIVLCDFQEMSYAEAAIVLDCAIGTVNSRLHRGHALLLKKLRGKARLDSAPSDAEWIRCFI